MIDKTCKNCENNLPATSEFFYKDKGMKDGLMSRCRKCHNKINNEHREKNKEKINAQKRVHRKENRDAINLKNKEYNHNQGKEKRKAWKQNNKEKVREDRRRYDLVRRNEDPEYKLLTNLRNRLRMALARNSKSGTTTDLVGCSIGNLRVHLANQFKPGMSWDNYGDWHVDHIKPCAYFDLSDPEQQKQCFHFTNLQPLWATDNMSKGARLG